MAEKVHANHGRDHQHGAADPTLIAYEAVGDPLPVYAVWVNRTLTAQSIPNNAVTIVSFDSVYYDDGDFADLGVSATTLTVPATGIYTAHAYVRWVGHGTSWTRRLIQIGRGSTGTVGVVGVVAANDDQNLASVGPDQSVTYVGYLEEADTLNLSVLQTSGGSLNMTFGSLSVARIVGLP